MFHPHKDYGVVTVNAEVVEGLERTSKDNCARAAPVPRGGSETPAQYLRKLGPAMAQRK